MIISLHFIFDLSYVNQCMLGACVWYRMVVGSVFVGSGGVGVPACEGWKNLETKGKGNTNE
jgi:hypothetical protein